MRSSRSMSVGPQFKYFCERCAGAKHTTANKYPYHHILNTGLQS